jgi:hypothetical protein
MCNAVTHCTDNCTECLREAEREKMSEYLKELIDDAVNDIFAEYQASNDITNGDISPMDALKLEQIEEMLKAHIEYVCAKQKEATQ